MNTLRNLFLTLLLCAGCMAPGSYTQFSGHLSGHVRVNSSWLVGVGMAKADLTTALPQGILVSLPLHLREGSWLAINLVSGEVFEGSLTEPLPPGAAALYGEHEWQSVLVHEVFLQGQRLVPLDKSGS